MTTLPKIHFVQYKDNGRFDSTFGINKTNYEYFYWRGKSLPDDNPLRYLEKLRLVDRKTKELMHGYANFSYHLEQQDVKALVSHLGTTPEKANELVTDLFKWELECQYQDQMREVLDNLKRAESEDKKVAEERDFHIKVFEKQKRVQATGKTKSEETLFRVGFRNEYPHLFTHYDKIQELKKRIADLETSRTEFIKSLYEPHKQHIAKLVDQAEKLLEKENGSTFTYGEAPSDSDQFILINGVAYPIVDIYEGGYLPILSTGCKEFTVAQDSEHAGEKVEEYYRDTLENDKEQFKYLVGEDNLLSWSLGEMAGPGSTKVRSLEDWFELVAEYPEEQWASCDGLEVEAEISPALQEELGFDSPLIVAYRSN